jgi:GT2 family glycosyltransferase
VNPVLVLTRNCLELTKKCIASVMLQDVPVRLLVIDNGSTDGTIDWLESPAYRGIWAGSLNNDGVSKGWNRGLKALFADGAEHVLVCNNDTVLSPWTYRLLLDYNAPFVTGASFGDMSEVMTPQEPRELTGGPDFSCFLIRKDAWEKVGPFDEEMVHYCGDCDWHLRAHRLGLFLGNSHVKFFHQRSSTLKRASRQDQIAIARRAELDRNVFYAKYGCLPGEPGYAELFLEQPVNSE